MPQYLSPGVYVEEVPSAVKAIAGVGTSTAGFIGIVPSTRIPLDPIANERVGTGDGTQTTFRLARTPVDATAGKAEVRINNNVNSAAVVTNESGFSQVKFTAAPAKGNVITVSYTPLFEPVAAGEGKLCTNFTEYKRFFGDFSTDEKQSYLAHAVYGFFNNGGSRCSLPPPPPPPQTAAPAASPATTGTNPAPPGGGA